MTHELFTGERKLILKREFNNISLFPYKLDDIGWEIPPRNNGEVIKYNDLKKLLDDKTIFENDNAEIFYNEMTEYMKNPKKYQKSIVYKIKFDFSFNACLNFNLVLKMQNFFNYVHNKFPNNFKCNIVW